MLEMLIFIIVPSLNMKKTDKSGSHGLDATATAQYASVDYNEYCYPKVNISHDDPGSCLYASADLAVDKKGES